MESVRAQNKDINADSQTLSISRFQLPSTAPPPPLPTPPQATKGHLPASSVPGVGHLQILPTLGLFLSFWHARPFLSEYNYTEDITGKKADWLICQGQGVVKACSQFYACISSLLIKPELHSETQELLTWINVVWLVNQISVDIIWRTSFHIYNIFTTYNCQQLGLELTDALLTGVALHSYFSYN